MIDRVLEAFELKLPPCPKCRALKGDPCRSPNWQTVDPHKARRVMADADGVTFQTKLLLYRGARKGARKV